jgi:MoxR-like ATPase
MAEGIEGSFHRIQFTPDLLPGDITGTDIFRPANGRV